MALLNPVIIGATIFNTKYNFPVSAGTWGNLQSLYIWENGPYWIRIGSLFPVLSMVFQLLETQQVVPVLYYSSMDHILKCALQLLWSDLDNE